MKKYIKILFISIVAIISALCLFACTPEQIVVNNGIVLPEVIEGDAGDYVVPPTTAYGQEPDLTNVIIDGKLDDELWQNKNWYSQYQSLNPTFKFEVSTAFSDKGLYLAAKSNDRYVYWLDRNKFWGNTHMTFRFISNDEGGMTRQFNIDANNTGPTGNILNVRSTYKGEINNPGKTEGLFVEAFLTWEQLGYKSKPSSVSLIPIYRYKMSRGENVRNLYNTFIVSDNSDNAAPVFDTNGYTDVDKAGVTVGTHNTGLNKTTGWKVEVDENGKETATVDCSMGSGHTPKNFTQAIFFKDAPIATRFMIKARLTVNSNVGFTRAGLLMFKDRLNYRAYGVEIGNNFNSSKKEFSSIALKGWTNFPSDIVTTTAFGNYPVNTDGRAKNEVDLTAFNNNGRIYYLLNDQFVYSETVNYAAGNCFIGLYAYNASVTFSNYEYKIYNTDDELRADIKDYIYTVDVYNVNTTLATVELSQIAASNDGTGSVDVIATYNQPRFDNKNQVYLESVLDSVSYSYVDVDGNPVTEDITELARENSKCGRFTIENVPGNIQITFQAKEVALDDYVNLEFNLKNEQSKQPISTATIKLYSDDGKFTNYLLRVNRGDGHVTAVVPKGYSWNVEVEAGGYRPYTGVLAGGAKVNESQNAENSEIVYVTATVVGGNAVNAKGDVIAGSAPGVYWDMSEEANSKVTFTSTNTGSSYVYFSGNTVSDYQVAYVEITNQTDYTAFRSIEDDPGVGFVITGEKSGVSSRALLWKTGVRIINNPSLSWSEGVKSIGGFCNFSGHTAVIDRANGGAVAGEPVLGSGTVNRVPYGDKTYTTSFLMIRRGGNVFLYAADGRAGVKKDKTNFSKMQLLYSYYNPLNTDAAAVGFAVTVSFNLRLDFENYWLITGEDAAAFADRHIKTDITVQGNEYLDVESGGMFEFNESTGKGKIALASQVELSYKDSLGEFPAGKLLKVTLPDGTIKLIGSKNDSCTFDITSISSTKWKVRAEMVNAATVKGKVTPPYDGFNVSGLKGAILNEAGETVANFTTSPEGEYRAVVEAGKTYMARVNVAGQVSTQPEFVASDGYEIPALTLTSLNIGATGTAGAVTYGNRDDLGGIYAQYKTASGANGAVYFKAEPKQNFVLEYSFIRSASPSGTNDETDLGIGMRITDGSNHVELMNMSDGYRILTNKTAWATKFEKRGQGGANVQPTNVSLSNYITIKFVKVGGVIYMYNKYASDNNFRLINTWTIASASDNSTPICTGAVNVGIWWTATGGRYLDLTFFNISLKDVNAETAPEIFGELNVTEPNDGSIVVTDAKGKTISNGTTLTPGDTVTITVTPPAGQRVKTLYINGTAAVLSGYKGGVLTYKHAVAGDVNVRADFEVAMRDVTVTLTGLAAELGVDTVEVWVSGALYKEMDTSTRESAFDADTALKSGNTLKMRLPEGVVTIKLYKDGELVQEFKDFDVTNA